MARELKNYYHEIEALDVNVSREENLRQLNEHLDDIKRRGVDSADKQYELLIRDAKKYFENESRYQEYRNKLFNHFKQELVERVYIAAIDGNVPPKKKHAIIQQCQSVLGLSYEKLSELLDEVMEEEGFETAEPDRIMQARYEDLKTSIRNTVHVMKTSTADKIHSTRVMRDFSGSQRALNQMVGSAVLLLFVHLTIGAIAGFWVLFVMSALYIWIKRER